MSTEIIQHSNTGAALRTWIESQSPETRRAYITDMGAFSQWRGAPPQAAYLDLCEGGRGHANLIVAEWRAAMLAGGASPATINRRLAAMRSALSFLRLAGVIDWGIEVRGVKSQKYRDTRGPERSEVLDMLRAASGNGCVVRRLRDVAIVRLLYSMALRRKEVAGLTTGDIENTRLKVLRKGRSEHEFRTMPESTARALSDWMAVRPDIASQAVFVSLSNSSRHAPLSGNGIYHIVRALGRSVGVETRPHGLRHSAITRALDETNGDIRAVQAFSGHKSPAPVLIYDDNRRDLAGEVAERVAGGTE